MSENIINSLCLVLSVPVDLNVEGNDTKMTGHRSRTETYAKEDLSEVLYGATRVNDQPPGLESQKLRYILLVLVSYSILYLSLSLPSYVPS